MALQLTADGLRKEVARLSNTPVKEFLPLAVTSATSFAAAGLLKQMKPGGFKTLTSLGAFVGGGVFVARSKGEFGRAIAMGIAGGGLWTLIMRS